MKSETVPKCLSVNVWIKNIAEAAAWLIERWKVRNVFNIAGLVWGFLEETF